MRLALALLSSLLLAGSAAAVETIHPGGFPSPAGPVAAYTNHLYNIIFIIVAVIGVGVAAAMGYIIVRFRRSRGHAPATFSHSTAVELLWTIIPSIICVYIAYISYVGLVHVRTMPEGAVNVEVVAYQFGWDFYYPDASENGVHVKGEEASGVDQEISLPGMERQTKELVIPVGKPIVAHVTSQDVIHAFSVPALGFKVDAMPGRINYVWFQADKPGNWLGQCFELCGSAHGEMFFRVKAVTEEEFAEYIKARRVDAGLTPEPVAPVSDTVVVSDGSISGTVVEQSPSVLVSGSVVDAASGVLSGTAATSPTN
jgi:cytochrome c oxidase subunit 2